MKNYGSSKNFRSISPTGFTSNDSKNEIDLTIRPKT